MRFITQAIVVAVLAGVGGGAWYVWQDRQASTPVAATATGRGGGCPPVVVEVVGVRSDTVIERSESVGTARANESVVVTAKQTGNVAII